MPLDFDLSGFLSLVAAQGLKLFGNYFEHTMAWAKEAEERPDTVRLCVVDQLGSLEPSEVRQEMLEIAEFLSVEADLVDRLVKSIFQRPPDACQSLEKDTLVDTAAMQGGHIVENTGRNLYSRPGCP